MLSLSTIISDTILIRLILSIVILISSSVGIRFIIPLLIQCLSKIKLKQLNVQGIVLTSVEKPLHYLLKTIGIYFAVIISPFVYYHTPNEQLLEIGELTIRISLISISLVNRVLPAIMIIFITWIIYELEHLYEQFFMDINTKLALIDNTVFIRYLSRILNFVTLTIGIALALVILIPNFAHVITGVGIGGVALAYVAKDSLASMFSGILLLLDKPFVIGDWITLDQVDGIVEDISFRSTRVRTFDQGLVVIPNNTVGNDSITNWSRMQKRRVTFNLGVSYSTSPEQVQRLMASIKTYLQNHPNIETETVLVHLTSLGDYTLNIQIIYYSLSTDLVSYSALKEDVNLELLKQCSLHEVEIAFPTQTIHVQNVPIT